MRDTRIVKKSCGKFVRRSIFLSFAVPSKKNERNMPNERREQKRKTNKKHENWKKKSTFCTASGKSYFLTDWCVRDVFYFSRKDAFSPVIFSLFFFFFRLHETFVARNSRVPRANVARISVITRCRAIRKLFPTISARTNRFLLVRFHLFLRVLAVCVPFYACFTDSPRQVRRMVHSLHCLVEQPNCAHRISNYSIP